MTSELISLLCVHRIYLIPTLSIPTENYIDKSQNIIACKHGNNSSYSLQHVKDFIPGWAGMRMLSEITCIIHFSFKTIFYDFIKTESIILKR